MGLVCVGVLGIALGIVLGLLLGRTGCIQFLSFVFKVPRAVVLFPEKIKLSWSMFCELKENRKIERMKRIQKIKDCQAKIIEQKKAITEIKREINCIKYKD